jgi:hypothetical protein
METKFYLNESSVLCLEPTQLVWLFMPHNGHMVPKTHFHRTTGELQQAFHQILGVANRNTKLDVSMKPVYLRSGLFQ